LVKGREQRGSPTEPTNPTQFAQTPPPMSSGDYSFLEIVMSMQSTMGELKEAVNGVTGAILGIFGKPIVELIFNRGTSAPQTSSDPTKPR